MRRVGSIKSTPLKDLADKAALALYEIHDPQNYVLSLSPKGSLRFERHEDAAEEDVIGRYTPGSYPIPRWIGLGKQIYADLEHEVNVVRRCAASATRVDS